jgi:hypothetical protein
MTPDEFRAMALSFAGATEGEHMRHPDFRAHGRVFATLAYPDAAWGMVKLPAADQKHLVEMHPQAFVPAKGAWGLRGSTLVRLDAVKADVLVQALDMAWQNSAAAESAKKAGKAMPRAR